LAQRAVERGGFVSYMALPDGSKAVYQLNINYLDALSNPGAAEPAELAAQ
jgi:sucrose phosphorylase